MSAEAGTDRIAEDLQRLVADVEALLQVTAGQAGDRIERLRAQAADSVAQARQRLAGAEEATLREVREAAESAEGYVREHPWQAVGVAAGIGLLLGLLLSRR